MNRKNLQETLVCNNVTWEKAIVCLYSVKSHLKIITEFVYIAAVRQQQIITFFNHTVEIKSAQQHSVRKSN